MTDFENWAFAVHFRGFAEVPEKDAGGSATLRGRGAKGK